MANVLIVAYLLIVLALIGVILIQRSEGGGLGMSSASGGMMSVRGSANLLTRTTAILAALFMAIAIGLTVLSELDGSTQNILDRAADGIGEGTGPVNVLDALNRLNAQGEATSSGLDLPAPQSGAAGGEGTPAPEAGADQGLALPAAGGEPADGNTQPAPNN